MREFRVLLLTALIVASALGYYVHTLTYPLIKEVVKEEVYKELPRLPDFQLIVAEEVPVNYLSGVRIGAVKRQRAELRKEEAKPPSYRLSFTFLGKKKYAIINGRLFREGERVSPDERIVRISEGKVLLSGRWGRRWLILGE